MHAGRTIALFVLVGFLLGVVVASIVVPPVLTWYNEPGKISPGKQVESVCNLPDVIRYATGHLIRGQLLGGTLGGVVFFVIGLAVERRRQSTASATAGGA
jgi:hypothetical protein